MIPHSVLNIYIFSFGIWHRNCEIKSIVPYGVFVEFAPGREVQLFRINFPIKWLVISPGNNSNLLCWLNYYFLHLYIFYSFYLPGQALCHISELSSNWLGKAEDVRKNQNY